MNQIWKCNILNSKCRKENYYKSRKIKQINVVNIHTCCW